LGEILANANFQPNENEEEKDVSYTDTGSDYTSIGGNTGERRETGYNAETASYISMFNETKEDKVTKRMIQRGDLNARNQERGTENKERMMEIEDEKDSWKYLSKGDYK